MSNPYPIRTADTDIHAHPSDKDWKMAYVVMDVDGVEVALDPARLMETLERHASAGRDACHSAMTHNGKLHNWNDDTFKAARLRRELEEKNRRENAEKARIIAETRQAAELERRRLAAEAAEKAEQDRWAARAKAEKAELARLEGALDGGR